MALVDYSDSSEDEAAAPAASQQARKRKRSDQTQVPPLPASFHDLYSSTVRTSTRDDPSLHGGRKRILPHVEGNWATHAYLEWHAVPAEFKQLCDLVNAVGIHSQVTNQAAHNLKKIHKEIHSLLEDDLGVPQPLHISLSRPLVLRTETKDDFLAQLSRTVSSSGVKPFSVTPSDLLWHPNEDGTRWFLVLRLNRLEDNELGRLLGACNEVAGRFNQPLLYTETSTTTHGIEVARSKKQRRSSQVSHKRACLGLEIDPDEKVIQSPGWDTREIDERFHISIAWRLQPPAQGGEEGDDLADDLEYSEAMIEAKNLSISFTEVKVRIGQGVNVVSLRPRIGGGRGILG